jgi:hypothetical protein
MRIAAVRSVVVARPTDSGNTLVVELTDGAEQRWTVPLPAAVARDLVAMLEAAGEEATGMRWALGRG